MPQTPLQWLYGVLALVGLVATWTFNLLHVVASGGRFDAVAFIRDGYANHAASSLANDLTVAAVVFLIWSHREARRLDMRRWWAYLAVTFGVAFACAFPLFLYMRERRLAELASRATPPPAA